MQYFIHVSLILLHDGMRACGRDAFAERGPGKVTLLHVYNGYGEGPGIRGCRPPLVGCNSDNVLGSRPHRDKTWKRHRGNTREIGSRQRGIKKAKTIPIRYVVVRCSTL